MSEFECQWHISSFSADGGCVEVRRDDAVVRVRDSKNPFGPVLRFNLREWHAFVCGVRNGEFDISDVVDT